MAAYPDEWCLKNCKGYQQTHKCYCDGGCSAHEQAVKELRGLVKQAGKLR